MIKIHIILVFILVGFCANSQQFTGKITYEVEYIATNNRIDIDSLLATKIDKETYEIGDGYYRSVSFLHGEEVKKTTYHYETNKSYFTTKDRPFTSISDASKKQKNPKKIKIVEDSTKIILGHPSFLVLNVGKNRTYKTYYSNDIKVKYENFKDHNTGNWNNLLEKLDGSMPLQYIHNYDDYTKITTAIKVTPKELSRIDFELEDKTMVIAQYDLDKKAKRLPFSKANTNCFMQYADNNIKLIREYGGKVYLQFVLMKNGEIKHLRALDDNQEPLNKLGLRIFRSCGFQFKVAKLNGEPVNSLLGLPLSFKI